MVTSRVDVTCCLRDSHPRIILFHYENQDSVKQKLDVQIPVRLRVVLQSGFGPRLKNQALAKTQTTKKLITKELMRASPDSIELYLLASFTAPLFLLSI